MLLLQPDEGQIFWTNVKENENGAQMTDTKFQEVMKRFTFRKPDAEGVSAMRAIRREVRSLAGAIETMCPESREKATALTQLATVMMHANSAIVQQYPVDENDI